MNEDKFQSECYQWFHESFPEYRGLLCYNLNNSRNKVRAMMDKGMGLQKGRSDMVFYFNGIATMFELKVKGGSQSPDQKKWEKSITESGFKYHLIWTLEDFKEKIMEIILNT